MTLFSSLRSRIFLASALLAVFSIGVALYLVNVRVSREAEGALQREISATAALVDQLRTTRTQSFMATARLIADIPQLKAAVDTNDPPTVRDIASRYQQQLGAQLGSRLLLVTSESGRVLATIGNIVTAPDPDAVQPAVRRALGGGESVTLLPEQDGILQLVTVPITIGPEPPEILGALGVGFVLDDGLASELKAVTGSEIAFGMNGRVLAATLPLSARAALLPLLSQPAPTRATIDDDEYVVARRPLAMEDGQGDHGPVALILRSRTEQLRFLDAIRTGLVATAVVAVALAVLLSFAVARTITRPLAAITGVMRTMASTGDLTHPIAVPQRRWDDEDARLLASTFSTLTLSVARFQREEAQRERLASLGRLSAVIAHEIRNPLMIIKAALHGLRGSAEPAAADAAADIEEEVSRLNRLVNDVLDFTRPITFDLAPADINKVCEDASRAASGTAGAAPPIVLRLDPALPPIRTDPERLRLVLVNVLLNARQAVAAVGAGTGRDSAAADAAAASRDGTAAATATVDAGPQAPVTLETTARGGRAVIVVADRGIGIAPEDLGRIFDPYFTTRRGGTGLGLAIARNFVEGLGGTIVASSGPGHGTEIRIELPGA